MIVDSDLLNEYQNVMRSYLSDSFISDFYKQINNYSYKTRAFCP